MHPKPSIISTSVAYGTLGTAGALGYEDKPVIVAGQRYGSALSAHAPSRLCYALDGAYQRFCCEVAINGDVPLGASHASFEVRGDGRRLALASWVVAGEQPQPLEADLRGVQQLELLVHTNHWQHCHSVWLNPTFDQQPPSQPAPTLIDPLHRATIQLPSPLPSAERCIATVVSPGFTDHLALMLDSLQVNGGCPDALVVIFAVDPDAHCYQLAEQHQALLIPCQRSARLDVMIKAVLYSVARVIDARQFICLDADMLVFESLAPLFALLDAAPTGSILACRESNYLGSNNLSWAVQHIYRGHANDLQRILGRANGELHYPLVVNDGLFAGNAAALWALDGVIRRMPQAISWVSEKPQSCWWRNQFIFNLALARLHCGVELNDLYNIQLHTQSVDLQQTLAGVRPYWRGQPVRVLHFCGAGKQKYREWSDVFAVGAF